MTGYKDETAGGRGKRRRGKREEGKQNVIRVNFEEGKIEGRTMIDEGKEKQ